jgi:hypothetical protein
MAKQNGARPVVLKDLAALESRLDGRFVAVDQRVLAVDQGLLAVDQRFGAVEQELGAVEQRLDVVEQNGRRGRLTPAPSHCQAG